MGLDIKAPEDVILKPIITVFGVGGAGGNAVKNMIKSGLKGANFVVANTDAQALKHSEDALKIQLGAVATKGLGAGASPDVGKEAAIESESEIRSHLEGCNMVFITAGMGGGTGTGASPVIAKIAKELGILTVGVVTKPFLFEGAKRMKIADKGLSELQQHVDTLIVIPNQNLFRIANEHTTFQEAFEMADEVLHAGVRGVTDLITSPGIVNLDFADIKTVMSEKGKAMMGTGEASGEDRAIHAAESAIANPLLDQSSMCGACGVLINITGGKDMTLYEVDSAANRIREEVGESEANIIFGSTFNPQLEGTIRVSVVATGIEQEAIKNDISNFNETEKLQQKDQNTENIDSSPSLSVSDNISVDDYDPPSYSEYDEKFSNSENQLNQKIEELTNEIGTSFISTEFSDDNLQETDTQTSQTDENVSQKKPKQSLLKRMWNSLKSGDSQTVKKKSSNIELKDNQNHVDPNVKEMPSFMRKE